MTKSDTPITFDDIQKQHDIDLEVARQHAVKMATNAWRPPLLVPNPDDPNTMKLRLQVDHLMPDRTQYKPYSVQYNTPIWVEVTVTLEMVTTFSEDYVVLTPDGIAHVADQLATALDIMHDEFRNRSRNF